MEKKNPCHDRFENGSGNCTGPEYMMEKNRLIECLKCSDAKFCYDDREQIFDLLKQKQYD